MNHMINGHTGNHDDSARFNNIAYGECQLCGFIVPDDELIRASSPHGHALLICVPCKQDQDAQMRADNLGQQWRPHGN